MRVCTSTLKIPEYFFIFADSNYVTITDCNPLVKVEIEMVREISARPTRFEQFHLAALRQARGISLEQIADATKISMRFLRAIEDEEFEKLPGGIFNTSYIRQYARAIAEEETELLAYYNRKTGVVTDAAPADKGSNDQAKLRFRFPTALARP
jgi:transcriptional regulator with XRE-family HTH domain